MLVQKGEHYRYISKVEWDKNTYPPFCWGPIYIMEPTQAYLLFQIFKQTLKEFYIWIEDVYITGI